MVAGSEAKGVYRYGRLIYPVFVTLRIICYIILYAMPLLNIVVCCCFEFRVPNAGTTYLTQLGIDHETAWDLWHNMLALGIIVIGLMFLAYVQLRRIPKLK